MSRLSRFVHLTRRERWLLAEALSWLAMARVALLLFPFRWIAPRLGKGWGESPEIAQQEEAALASQVGWAVRTAARHSLWQNRCLVQALAVKAMLRRRGVASTLYLGVAQGGAQAMEAHAWVRVGEVVLTGAGDIDRHTIVATFGEEG